jgi:hypothetical protein
LDKAYEIRRTTGIDTYLVPSSVQEMKRIDFEGFEHAPLHVGRE